MKVYNYQCQVCEHIQEAFVKTSDQEVTCENCGAPTNKLVSSPCFILNGVGVTGRGTFTKAKEGPKLDKDFMRLSTAEMDYELGLPPGMCS